MPRESTAVDANNLCIIGSTCYIHEVANFMPEQSANLMLWNDDNRRCLMIDRFDVRALLSSYDSFCRRKLQSMEEIVQDDDDDIMFERYRDLFLQDEEVAINSKSAQINQHTYSNAKFDYKSNREEKWEKPKREEYSFSNYLKPDNNMVLPMTKKQFDIMLHTVKNIREKGGGQLEILLKVKHDNDIMFDFFNCESELFPLYQHLKTQTEEIFWQIFLGRMKTESEVSTELQHVETVEGASPSTALNSNDSTNNALQLLGSMYDSDNDCDSVSVSDSIDKSNTKDTDAETNSNVMPVNGNIITNDDPVAKDKVECTDMNQELSKAVQIAQQIAALVTSAKLNRQNNTVVATGAVCDTSDTNSKSTPLAITTAQTLNPDRIVEVKYDPFEGPVTAKNIILRLEHADYRDCYDYLSEYDGIFPLPFTTLLSVPSDGDFSDDQLDADVDEGQVWGKPHKEKRERSIKLQKAERLRKLRENKHFFTVDTTKTAAAAVPIAATNESNGVHVISVNDSSESSSSARFHRDDSPHSNHTVRKSCDSRYSNSRSRSRERSSRDRYRERGSRDRCGRDDYTYRRSNSRDRRDSRHRSNSRNRDSRRRYHRRSRSRSR